MPSHQPSRAQKASAPRVNEDEDYNRRAHAQNVRYTQEWNSWWASLSDAERQQLAASGITEPLQDSSRVSGHAPGEDRDAAESHHAKVGFAYPSFREPPANGPAPATNPWLDPAVALVMQRVIGMLISAENAKVSVIALAFALNLDALNGLGSLREAALKMGLSPEAISKKKREWEKELDLPPNAFAKSPTAKLALSVAQRTKHWKKAKWQPLQKPSRP